jgi:hypothetical protein
VTAVGHRGYIGGRWDEIGKLQFDFMVSRGLRPEHVFLDIACGALRGGVYFIPYLDEGNYLGIDQEQVLIDRALAKELPADVQQQKRPEFVVSNAFEFDRFSRRPQISLAQSLFTHLIRSDIELCVKRLRAFVASGHEFYATFRVGRSDGNRAKSHAHARFVYMPDELEAIGRSHGWDCEFLGDWGHPRGQQMMRFAAR